MKAFLPKENLIPWMKGLSSSLEVIAPVDVDGEAVYQTWKGQPPDLFGNTLSSPVEVLMPRVDVLFRYVQNSGRYTFDEPKVPSRVIIGMKPCDLQAVAILDRVFGSEPADRPYLAKRRSTLLVSLNCTEPGPLCFCAVMGSGPGALEGFDLALTDLGSGYLAEAGSAAGVLMIKGSSLGLFLEADRSHQAGRDILLGKARSVMAEKYDDRSVEHLRRAIRFADWESLGRQCMSCGGCSFICPVCHCFSIADLGIPDGERVRCRDTCLLSGFSRMTSGVNPLGNIGERMRNWYLDKFEHLPGRTGLIGCVGCGRCDEVCLSQIDRWKLEVLDERSRR